MSDVGNFWQFLGKILLVSYYVIFGAALIFDPTHYQRELVDGYAKSYARFFELTKVHFILTPAHIAIHSNLIILFMAIFQIFSSTLVVLNFKLGAKWLIWLQIMLILIIENPLLLNDFSNVLLIKTSLNLGMIGCLFHICGETHKVKIKEE